MKRVLSISHLIVPLLAVASALSLTAQTIVVDKTSLTFNAQVGGAAVTQTMNVTSSTGAAIPFTLSFPGSTWLKVSGISIGYVGTTPASLTVTADATGLAAGTLTGSIAVTGGSSSNPPIAVTFNVSAIGVSPTSLALGYTQGSTTFPSPQILTLTGAATQCTAAATVTTPSGVGWFSLLPSACIQPGTLAVAFNSGVIGGLAPGTYTGNVTVTPVPSGTGPAVVVPVTLTVVPTPPVTFDPPSLVFNWQTGTPNPVRTFNVYAPQPLSVGVTGNVDTGNWSFSVIDTGAGVIGSAGSLAVSVTLNPNGIAPGTYIGRLTLSTPGGSPALQVIQVTFNVSATPLLNVPNSTLKFAYQLTGGNPPSQSVNIGSTGTLLSYSVTTGSYDPAAYSNWLIVNTSGTTAAPFAVFVDPTGLPLGTYSARINVLSGTLGSVVQQIPVVLTVTNYPVISASVAELRFPFQIGRSAPAPQSVQLSSSSGVLLNYSASFVPTNCGSNWLRLNGASTTVTGSTPNTLVVSIATADMVFPTVVPYSTTCTGTLTVTATDPATGASAVHSPLSIPVTLTVSTSAQLVLNPPGLPVFTVGLGAPSPAPRTIALTSTNADVLTYTVAFEPAGSWLSVNTAGGATGDGNTLTISLLTTPLAASTYSGTVTITATGPGGAAVLNSPITIPVTLVVSAGSLSLSPSTLSFTQTLGGPAPPPKTVTVVSTNQPLNYTAVATTATAVKWLSVSPASGNTSTNGFLSVAVDATGLTPGATYSGTITVTSPGASNSPATINVSFTVNQGTISAPITTLTFTQVSGGPPPSGQTIAVTSTPSALNFTVISGTLSGGTWLTAAPDSTIAPSTVRVSVDGGLLMVGQYQGSVTIAAPGASGSPINVPVILNVVTPATLTATPPSLSFAYTVGQSAVATLNVVVSATGTTVTTVPLNAEAQYEGAGGQSWLTVTPASGNAPVTFSVSILPGNLSPGTYNGKVVVNSPSTLVAATIPVSLTVTAVPLPIVAAVTNAASYSTGAVSPGENISIFGSGIGPATLVHAVVSNNIFPSVVANTRVLFDDTPAPVLFASAAQTSVMVPYGVAGRSTTNIVVEYLGVKSAPLNYNVTAAAPGIYTVNQKGTGPGAILNQDLGPNSATNPEKPGNVIAIYMTGEGQTAPAGENGVIIPAIAQSLKHPVLAVSVTIGGIDAVVAYAGSAPAIISGVMQVNAVIPANTPSGAQPVVVTVGTTAKSQSGAGAATVAVQ